MGLQRAGLSTFTVLAAALLVSGCDGTSDSFANPMELRADDIEQRADEWVESLQEEQRVLLERGARGDSDAQARAMALEAQIDERMAISSDRASTARDAGGLLAD